MEMLEKYVEFLLTEIQKDSLLFNQLSWIYYFVLPIIGVMIYVLIKYTLLTAPFWLPFKLILSAFSNIIPVKK